MYMSCRVIDNSFVVTAAICGPSSFTACMLYPPTNIGREMFCWFSPLGKVAGRAIYFTDVFSIFFLFFLFFF